MLLLTSCTSQPSDQQLKLTSTFSPQPATATPVPSPTIEPTATPFVPLTVEEIEEKLEAYTGEELELNEKGIHAEDELYTFENNHSIYMVDNQTGDIRMYLNNAPNSDPEKLLDEEGAKQVAIQELKKNCPHFFDYDYTVGMHKSHETTFQFTFTQLSAKGRHTGNSLIAGIIYDGTVSVLMIHNDENVDGQFTILEEQAIDSIYKAASQEAIKNFSTDGNKAELDLQNKDDHKVDTYLASFKGTVRWFVTIENVEGKITTSKGRSVTYIFTLIGQVDANTGEVEHPGYGATLEMSDED